MRRRLHTYVRLVRDVLRFPAAADGERLVYVDLADPLLNKRYTYLFLKFLLLGGLQVVLRYRGALVLRFNDLKNTSLLFSEGDLYLLPSQPAACRPSMSDRPGADKVVTLDYFGEDGGVGAYRIPMAMHPFFYHTEAWKEDIEVHRPVHSVVFSGNLKAEPYGEGGRLAPFGMPARMEQVRRLRDSTLPLEERMTGPPEGRRLYLLDKDELGVHMEGWRSFLAGFRFFLALPGKVMPLCHNVVEAMSVGAVPVMHESYARLFDPPLEDGRQVVIYPGGDPVEGVERALSIPPDDAERISAGALGYYRRHLVPEAVVPRILAKDVRLVRLCGEGDSVRLMEGDA